RQSYETGRGSSGKGHDQLSAWCTPLDLRSDEQGIPDFGGERLVVQVSNREDHLGRINLLGWIRGVADRPSVPDDQVGGRRCRHPERNPRVGPPWEPER